MGADLYAVGYEKHSEDLRPLFQEACKKRDMLFENTPGQKEAQAEVERTYNLMNSEEFYFRDSYNDSSIMWRLGLSWWRDVEVIEGNRDGGIEITKENPHGVNMPPYLCIKLAEKIEKTEVKLLTVEEYNEKFTKDETIEQWNSYFIEKKAKLIKFLKTCANEGGLDASV